MFSSVINMFGRDGHCHIVRIIFSNCHGPCICSYFVSVFTGVRSIECSHIVGNFFPFKNESGGTVGCAVVVSLAGSRDRIADARLDTRETGPSPNNPGSS